MRAIHFSINLQNLSLVRLKKQLDTEKVFVYIPIPNKQSFQRVRLSRT